MTEEEAEARRLAEGYNELPAQRKQSSFSIILEVLRQPMLALLLACGAIYFFIGEESDALMLLTFVVVVAGITCYQERKTKRALEALRRLSSPRAIVIRDGAERRVPGRDLVRDDIILLREGDRVPADAVVLAVKNLLVDESLLTGEAGAVRKSARDGKEEITHPGGEDLPFVFSGTMVARGRATAKVTAVGSSTEIGRIGKSLARISEEDTLLQKEVGRLVRNFALVGAILCLLIVIVYGLTRGDWVKGFLSGLTLGMAMLPEEFSVVLLVFLALGAWRISKRKVLTRRTAAIETLGATTVMCVDKTGTLTVNRMRLDGMTVDNEFFDLAAGAGRELVDREKSLLRYAELASDLEPFDPLEKAIKEKSFELLSSAWRLPDGWKLAREYPLSKELVAMSRAWKSSGGEEYAIAAKGAPEAMAELCRLDAGKTDALMREVGKMSARGLRVLGVARSAYKGSELPEDQRGFDFELLGLLGFTDPVRPLVPESVKECYRAGIRIIMITGDYPGTAVFVAREIGLANPGDFITGAELRRLSAVELKRRINDVNIFARVAPEQKLAIVNALKANGEIVAMTGDGVNDAPALKASHIGVAMGERGTDVARETADLVLLNDDFSSIVMAVKMGRRIFDNLKKAMAYIFSVHIPIAGMALLPVLADLPIVLFPVHIAFLELIIDPACSVVFESERSEEGIMDRPPRNLESPLFDRRTFFLSILQGLSVLAVVFCVFLAALWLGMGEIEARTLAFASIVFGNLMLIVTNLSHHHHFIEILRAKNKALFWVLGGTVSFLALVLYLPELRDLFHLSFMHVPDLLLCLLASSAGIIWFEIYKVIGARKA